MQVGLIDIGANSIHLKIYDVIGEKHHTLLHTKISGGLINYIENNMLSKEGIKQLVKILKDFKTITDLIGIQVLRSFATASLRNVVNADKVVKIVKEKVGIDIDVISGYVESNLGFIGLQDFFHARQGVTIDMGGGSTEFLKFKDFEIEQVTSIPFGCLALYQYGVQLVLPTKEEVKNIQKYVRKELKALDWVKADTLYLTGGTAKSFAKIHMEINGIDEDVNGYTMSKKEYHNFYNTFMDDKPATAKILTKLVPERVHTLLPGMIAYKHIFQMSGCEKIIISEAGVREGYLCKKILPNI